MRRPLIAAALLSPLLFAACGPNPGELEPGLRDMLRDFGRSIIVNDKEKIISYVLPSAGQRENPVGAKDLDTAEGRERIMEGNRRWCRKTFKDAGIVEEKDLETFLQALRIGISGRDAMVTFEIAAEGRRAAEIVTFRMTLTERGWRVFDYYREMKGMR